MKSDKYRQIQWTNTEMNRNKKERKAQNLINKQSCESINKKNVYVVAVA